MKNSNSDPNRSDLTRAGPLSQSADAPPPAAPIALSSEAVELVTGTDLMRDARRQGTIAVASVFGTLDLHTSPEFRHALLEVLLAGGTRKVILNLAHVDFMDSSALAVLVEGLKHLRRCNGKIYLTNLQPRVRGLLEIARLNSIFVLVKDVEEAMRAD